MALYLGSTRPVATVDWQEGESVLFIQALSKDDGAIRSQFTRPHVVYLGAHTGCSCGFSYGQSPASTPEGIREDELGRQSVAALRRMLEEYVSREEMVELFACWEGDQGVVPGHRLSVTPEFFGGNIFDLQERALYHVRRAA